MADEAPVTPTTPAPSAGNTPTTPVTAGASPDPVTMAQELGRLKKIESEFNEYKAKTDPVIQTIWNDPDTFQHVSKAHERRLAGKLGIEPDENPKETPVAPIDNKIATQTPSPIEVDNRNTLISQTVGAWEEKHGMNKLTSEKKGELNQKVMNELKLILDPAGTGKEGAKLLEGVSLTHLPKVLEKAYQLATIDEREEKLREMASDNSSQGMIGALSSGSVNEESDEVTLTEKEKQTAKKQGITPDVYLKNKKEIAKRNNSIY